MADLLGQAAGWLDGQRAAHLASPVVYQRGADFVEVAATLGSTRYEVTDDAGATVQAVATDFIVSAAELVLGGSKTLPQPGDRIVLADGRVFEVMDLAGAGHYRPCDPYGVTLRIHAKQVEAP